MIPNMTAKMKWPQPGCIFFQISDDKLTVITNSGGGMWELFKSIPATSLFAGEVATTEGGKSSRGSADLSFPTRKLHFVS